MENRIEYVHACELAMFSYLKTMDLDKLIADLRKVERHAKRTLKSGKDKTLWFKFFKGDTGATDINDLEIGLNPNKTSRNNLEYFTDNLKEVIRLDGGLQVYYS